MFSFPMKLKVAGWKENLVQVHSCEFCYIFKNNYVVVHVRTAASDILGYSYVEISSVRSTFKKCAIFSDILVFIHFKLILESCTTFVFSQKHSIIDILQGSKYGSAASFFNFFTTFFVWLLEWIYEHFIFLLKVCSYFAHVT